MRFTPALASPYREGTLFLGNADGREVGISTDRHAITIAGARSGKGAGLIIQNLRRWTENAVVIDTKGENAEHSWEAREAMGQKCVVIDPFKVANVPDRLRGSFNPLTLIDPESRTAREDARVIADGLVMRYKPEDAMWDNGAVSVLAGLIAHVRTVAPPDLQTLPEVRALLRLPADDLAEVFEAMADNSACGNLAKSAATVGLSTTKKDQEYLSAARENVQWLDSGPMAEVLENSTFDLSELKTARLTLFLVLPPEYLDEHGRFLRLFVRCALNAMAKGGQVGRRCLFILDEFFSLGHIGEIHKAAGLMPSYGVHLWPFLQDIGQLQKLYGREGAESFFGNADVHSFFALHDTLTLEYLSQKLGIITPDEAAPDTPYRTAVTPNIIQTYDWDFKSGSLRTSGQQDANAGKAAIAAAQYDNERSIYQHRMARAGRPRLAPDEIRELVAKKSGDAVARSMIVFGKGGDVFKLALQPYFLTSPVPSLSEQTAKDAAQLQAEKQAEAARHAAIRAKEQQQEETARKIGEAIRIGFIAAAPFGAAIIYATSAVNTVERWDYLSSALGGDQWPAFLIINYTISTLFFIVVTIATPHKFGRKILLTVLGFVVTTMVSLSIVGIRVPLF